MAEGYKDFTDGSRLYAAEIEEYAQNQAVMRFASAAARDTALATVKTEGMLAYLKDVDQITWYDGSAWKVAASLGAWTTWAPTVTQTGGVSLIVTDAKQSRGAGQIIHFDAYLLVTGSGTAGTDVVISLPVATSSRYSVNHTFGQGFIYDSSASTKHRGLVTWASSTSIKLQRTDAANDGYLGTLGFTAGLAAGDLISVHGFYEPA